MYALAALAAILNPVFAQNATFVAELLQELQALNLTSLANASQVVANTSTGQALLTSLSEGPTTVFAPSNDACESIPTCHSSSHVVRVHFLTDRTWM